MENKNTILAIIQARSNSTRLPGKILKNFSNSKNTIDFIIESLNFLGIPITLATTNNASDNELYEMYKHKVTVFRGDEQNVLSRFTEIIKTTKPNYIIRICADNPFILSDGIKFLIDHALNNPHLNYISFKLNGKPAMKVSLGIFAEIIKADTIASMESSSSDLEKEHVTINLYNESSNNYELLDFEKFFFKLPSDLRFTIDTQEDFDNVNQIISDLHIDPPLTLNKFKQIVNYSQNSNLISRMKLESDKIINSKNYFSKGSK